ncbi:MAG: Fic family protein [Clostridia bacterium]|nr:Fic family protein [Clostridia bacterium]
MQTYVPPFDITEEMLDLTSEIMEELGKLSDVNDLAKLPRLRRINRIRSIQSSLAIENNTLSLAQVTDVIDGKRVLGPADDILAVKNAFSVYKSLPDFDPFSLDDLKKSHEMMMKDLVDGAGDWRTGSVGVFNEKGQLLHLAPPADRVEYLMQQLFSWAQTSKTQMLIRSSVFHYEFEFIHPFADGNGRTGRLWQTVLLADWKPIFEWIPIESIIKDNQEEYYKAITRSTKEGKSNAFILFMLGIIKKAVGDLSKDTRNHQSHISNQIKSLMSVIESYPMTATELMEKLALKSRLTFRKNYLQPALDAGLIGMTAPDKPTSPNQRYFRI